MATWTQIETGLAELLADLLGIPCDWRSKPRKTHVTCAQIDYLTGIALGVDEPVWADVPVLPAAPTSVQATVYGLREFTLQVRVVTFTQKLGDSARAHLETLRSKLRLPSTLERLRALGIALVRIEHTTQIDPTQNGRVVSEAAMDARFAHGTATVDAAIPYIETVHITSADLGVDLTVPEP